MSFAYPNTTNYALRDINISIMPGQKLGIVGLNGAGKTTLIKLLLRVYFPKSGRITLGGIDISEIPYQQYVKHIGVVLHDFSLFAYSIKENIVFDGECNSKKLSESIEKSGLTDKIANLSNGVDTSVFRELDDNGIEFSGGEGQKLAMARAVNKNSPILILDEPTDSLDPKSESEIYDDFFNISAKKTTIFISHRLASSARANKILVFDNGKIVEQGNHTELLRLNKKYAEMFNMQKESYVNNTFRKQRIVDENYHT